MTPPRRVQVALDALLEELEPTRLRLGLTVIERLLRDLGDPQKLVPMVLVAGSNGKGSTAALLAAMATAAGYRTGLYTSPHLERVEERLRVDGESVASTTLLDLVERVLERAAPHADGPTYFEVLTAAAFLHFAERRLDMAVVEVGLGGRLDATNACLPTLSLITELGLEHERLLGSTIEEIAREKAGILRAGTAALAWVRDPGACAVLDGEARRLGAALDHGPDLVAVEPRTVERSDARRRQGARLRTPRTSYELSCGLLGEHQLRNLALAVLAAERLADLGFDALGPSAIAAGAAACRWPARLEWVELPGGRQVLLDGAHNPSGVTALGRYLDQLDGDLHLLFGVLADKDPAGMLDELESRVASVIVTTPPGPRGRSAVEVAQLMPGARLTALPELEAALDELLGRSGTAVICGSLHLVGAARASLRRRYGVPDAAVEVRSSGAPAP